MQSKAYIAVSVPCLTCRIARTFTILARRGTLLTLQLSVESSIIYTIPNCRIFPCVFGKPGDIWLGEEMYLQIWRTNCMSLNHRNAIEN